MNAQREVIYKRRRNALHGDRIRTDIANMFFDLVEMNVDSTGEKKDLKVLSWVCLQTYRILLMRGSTWARKQITLFTKSTQKQNFTTGLSR